MGHTSQMTKTTKLTLHLQEIQTQCAYSLHWANELTEWFAEKHLRLAQCHGHAEPLQIQEHDRDGSDLKSMQKTQLIAP
jgi:hypothetical protein